MRSPTACLGTITALLLASGATPAQEPPKVTGECVIQVAGKTYKDGPCRILLFPGGGFQTGGEHRGEAFAVVNLDAAHVATASWNGVDRDSHAHDDLGAMRRDGGCWFNDHARVCAWRAGTRPR